MGPLEGVLVVALEQAVAAPFCTQRLVDAGARVIKVERDEGDFARGYDHAVQGESAYFAWLNHGKESLVLDIKRHTDAALLERIIRRADIFIQNLAPGAAARAGFGSEALRARHPRLITCDISGYGAGGALHDRKAYDLLIQCEAGLASVTGVPEAPGRVGVSVADIACGMNAYAALLEALTTKSRTGNGSGVAISLFDSIAEWMAVPLLHHDYGGVAPGRVGLAHPSIAPYGAFLSRDNRLVVISIQSEREWDVFCRDILESPGLVNAVDYADNSRRVANRTKLDRLVSEAFGILDHEVLVAKLAQSRIAFGSVNGVEALSTHPALKRRAVGIGREVAHIPVSPLDHREKSRESSVVPAVGAHNLAIRKEFA